MRIQIALNTDFVQGDHQKSTLAKIYSSDDLFYMTFGEIILDLSKYGSMQIPGHKKDLQKRTTFLYNLLKQNPEKVELFALPGELSVDSYQLTLDAKFDLYQEDILWSGNEYNRIALILREHRKF